MDPLERDLERMLAEIAPRRLLCIAEACGPLSRYAKAHDVALRRLSPDDTDRLARAERFDFVYLADTLERLPKAAGERLLARLRDLHGGRFAALLPLGPAPGGQSGWSASELLALGLVRLAHYPGADRERYLYGFDLASYKPTPDWLNPRFWANPERWDEAWW